MVFNFNFKVNRCPHCTFGTKSRRRFLRHLQHHRRLRRLARTTQRYARLIALASAPVPAPAPLPAPAPVPLSSVFTPINLIGYRCAICPYVASDSEGYIQHVARHSRLGIC